MSRRLRPVPNNGGMTLWDGRDMQTFNYSQHNMCGGPSHRKVTQGPKVSVCVGDKIINLNPAHPGLPKPKPEEGHYVSREKGTMRPSDFMMLVRAKRARAKVVETPAESTEEWLKRHKIGVYAS